MVLLLHSPRESLFHTRALGSGDEGGHSGVAGSTSHQAFSSLQLCPLLQEEAVEPGGL